MWDISFGSSERKRETYAEVHVRGWFELSITTALTVGRTLIIVLSVIANVVELLVCFAGKVGWTLVAFLAVVLDRDELRLEGGNGGNAL